MTATPDPTPTPASARLLSQGEFTTVASVAAATGVLGLLGFVNSFAGVMAAAEPTFGALAWTVPLGIDLGIAVLAALDITLARLNLRIPWLRLVPWTLVAGTVYLNIAAYLHGPDGPDWFAVIAHALLPLLWVIAVEVGAHILRKRAGLAGDTAMDGIRWSRWILAPWSTLNLWRRMVLWEVRSYAEALRRERDRILAKTDLQDTYGWWWRLTAPRRQRALYRLGDLTPARLTTPPLAPATDSPKALPAAKPPKRPTRAAGRKPYSKPADVDALMPLGWRIAADHENQGIALTRDRLRDAIRATGQSISTDRAGALLHRLKTEAPTEPDQTSVNGQVTP